VINRAIPLRSTTEWPGFARAETLPERYGRTSGLCVRANASGTLWVWAGHACKSITAVSIDRTKTGAWSFENRIDPAGKPVCYISLTEPQAGNVEVSATGIGKINATTGEAIDRPAAVMADLCRISGVTIPSLDEFARETDQLEIGGTIAAGQRLGSVLWQICDSINAAWAVGGPVFARSLASAGADQYTLRERSSGQESTEFATRCVVSFGDRDGDATGSVTVAALALESQRGITTNTHRAPWVTTARVAIEVARARLAARYGLRFEVVGDSEQGVFVPPLSRVRTASGSWIAERVEFNPTTEVTTAYGSTAPAFAYDIDTVSISAAFADQDGGTLESAPGSTDYRYQITDVDSGEPIPQARAFVNGQGPLISDSGGFVYIPRRYLRGTGDKMRIESLGRPTITIDLVLPA
jgi:hypothetical protein